MKTQNVAISESSDSTLISKYEDSILAHVRKRLLALGWDLVSDRHAEETNRFEGMIPAPKITFSVTDTATGETRAVAFHFNESGDDIHYVCTMQLGGNGQAEERGQFNKNAETLTVLTTHDQWRCPRPKLSAVAAAISVPSLKKPLESVEPEVGSLQELIAAKELGVPTVRARKGRKSTSTD
jgi:hypothetical protein